MKAGLVLAAMLTALPASLHAQDNLPPPVEYDLSFANAVHHEARIKVTWRDIGADPLVVRMARSSPGRYAIHEFAKNVYSLSATDGAGRALPIERSDPYQWTIAGHDGTVMVEYTLYADRADGTYSQVDTTHAHLSMPATLMWAHGMDERPAVLRFHPLDPAWTIATQLQPTDDPAVFRAPGLQYLMDSPTELSGHAMREWQVRDGDETRTIRLTIHDPGTSEDIDRFAEQVRDVVAQQIAMFGDVPDYDYGAYTFVADYMPQVSGDGMEHRNSTSISSSKSLYEADFAQLGTASHEFFHSWNVERIRPAGLEPFDFTRANPTPSLWFAEGFTSYYGPMMIRRAGRSSLDAYLSELTGTLNYVLNGTGRRYGSPQEMSLRAPFVDAATAIDPTNNANIFTSYYPYGATIALALDLTLRRDYPGKTLDDFMRLMWQRYGVTEIAYQPADLETVLGDVTGDADFARRFFDRSIRGSDLPDLAPLLEQAGVVLRLAHAGDAWLGDTEVESEGDAVRIASNTAPGSPLYDAGLDRGDEIIRLDRLDIDSKDDWDQAIARHTPGETVRIAFDRRGEPREADITFAENPALETVSFESAGRTPSRAQRAFRLAWLGDPATD